MAKVYFRKYKDLIDVGEITVDEAIAMAYKEVPLPWTNKVVAMLNALKA